MARQRTYAPSNYSSSTAKSFSGSAATKSAQDNRSTYNREKARTSQYTAYTPAQVKSGKAKVDLDSLNDLKFKKVSPVIPGSILINATGQKSLEKNVSFFRDDKRTIKARTKYGVSAEGYKNYMKDRLAGNIDAGGNNIPQNNNSGNNQPTIIKKNIGGSTIQTTAPTEAEVSQSEAANADAAALKVKKRGRSASIMTGSKGVTKTSTDYSLGKKSLLGRV